MPTTSSSYAGNTLQTRVEREPQQLNTGLDKLADYVSAYKPRQRAAQQAQAFGGMGSAVPAGMDGGTVGPPQMVPTPPPMPVTEQKMDQYGRWTNWVDPRAAELYNTGRVLGGRVAQGPGQKDDYNFIPGGGAVR